MYKMKSRKKVPLICFLNINNLSAHENNNAVDKLLSNGARVPVRNTFHIAYVYSLWQDLSNGTIIFDLVTLTLKFDLLLKKL